MYYLCIIYIHIVKLMFNFSYVLIVDILHKQYLILRYFIIIYVD